MKTSQNQISNKLLLTLLLSGILYATQAQTIQPYHAKQIQPYKAQEVKLDRSKDANLNSDKNKGNIPSVNNSLDSFFGLYQYWVPGASYTTTDYTNQQMVLHNSAGTGVLPGGISITKSNTYVWNSSWDNKIIKGTWRATGDQGYPILLLKAQEGKNWKVGKSNDKGADIVVWDGYTWYNGKRLRK